MEYCIKMKRILFILIGLFSLSAKNIVAQTVVKEMKQPEMADAMRAEGKIYVVVAVMTVVLLGVLIYLIRLDRKIAKIEGKQNK